MRGGKREGAGRPSAPYATKMMRVPVPLVNAVMGLIAKFRADKKIDNK